MYLIDITKTTLIHVGKHASGQKVSTIFHPEN
jgi:hypothetical protein